MKREISRKKFLPAYRIDIPEVGLLWQKSIDLFPDPKSVHCVLTLKLSGEELKFASFDELVGYQGLPPQVSDFSLWVSQGNKHMLLRSSTLLGLGSEVSAGGESEAWCAGVVETVYSFLVNHKATYSWFVAAPLGWLISVIGVAPFVAVLAAKILQQELNIPAAAGYSWIAIICALALLYSSRPRLFPMSVLVVRETQGYVQRHVGELGLFVALASLVLTIISLFVAK